METNNIQQPTGSITPNNNTGGNDNNKQPNKTNLISMFEDNSGGISSTRVLMLSWGLGVLLIWGFSIVMAIITHGVMPNVLTPEVVTILLGVTGIKTVQRFGEK